MYDTIWDSFRSISSQKSTNPRIICLLVGLHQLGDGKILGTKYPRLRFVLKRPFRIYAIFDDNGRLISGVLADRHGIGRILSLSLMPLPFVALFWLCIGDYIPLMIVHMSVFGLWGMTWPVATAFLMRLAPTLERGSTLSINETAARLGFTIGPLLGGYFWFIMGAGTTFIASAIFFALSLFLILIIKE